MCLPAKEIIGREAESPSIPPTPGKVAGCHEIVNSSLTGFINWYSC